MELTLLNIGLPGGVKVYHPHAGILYIKDRVGESNRYNCWSADGEQQWIADIGQLEIIHDAELANCKPEDMVEVIAAKKHEENMRRLKEKGWLK